jgi:hypothetical protein
MIYSPIAPAFHFSLQYSHFFSQAITKTIAIPTQNRSVHGSEFGGGVGFGLVELALFVGLVDRLFERLCAMEDCKNFDLVSLDCVDDSVFSFDDFTNPIVFKFMDNSTGIWKRCDLLRSTGDPIDGSLGVGG